MDSWTCAWGDEYSSLSSVHIFTSISRRRGIQVVMEILMYYEDENICVVGIA
jgi:hypothetical protein